MCFWGKISFILDWVVLVVAPTLFFDTTGGEQIIKEQTVVIIKDIKLVDDVLGAVLADWSGRVDGVGGSCSSESESGTEVSFRRGNWW